MKYWREILRFLVSLQLLPVLESGEETTLVGGQAVFEGVMMRSPHAWGIAIRKPSGEMSVHSETLARLSEKHKWMGWPFIRGIATLGQAMRLGFLASRFSLNVGLAGIAEEEAKQAIARGETPAPNAATEEVKKPELSNWAILASTVFTLGFFLFAYKFVPLLAATGLKHHWSAMGNNFLFNLVDGAIRILLFLSFVWGISLFADIKRIYHYHGAEHKTVFAFENGDSLNTANVQKYSTYHPRCGTSFLMTVMLISIGFYMLVPYTTFWARFASRIVLLPVIAGVSYEIIRFAAKHRGSLFALITAPGLWLQRITTQPPSDEMAQCAITALDHAMALEKENGGELVIA